jgi:hypothetical protein
MVGPSVIVDVIRNLLPLDLGKSLFAAERLVMVRIDPVQVLLHRLVQEINLFKWLMEFGGLSKLTYVYTPPDGLPHTILPLLG